MKKLANLKGAKALNKNEQKAIQGGYDYIPCSYCNQCPDGRFCNGSHCVPCKYSPQEPCCIR